MRVEKQLKINVAYILDICAGYVSPVNFRVTVVFLLTYALISLLLYMSNANTSRHDSIHEMVL